MTRKTLIILATVIAVVSVGVFAVMAQDGDEPAVPFGPGWMHQNDGETFGFGPGMGMMGRGYGMHGGMGMMGRGAAMGYGPGMMLGQGEPMMAVVAEALGLEVDDYVAALQDGQTLAEIAEAQGVGLDSVYEAIVADRTEHVAALVEAGTITQEEADEHLAWLEENVSSMPMFSGAGFGPCAGQQAGFGPGMGMMGRGFNSRWGNS